MTYIPIHPDKVAIKESGVTFGPFLQDDCFCIEKHQCHKETTNVKPVEFLLLRRDKKKKPVIWAIEAKSSSPKSDFDEFIEDIKEKFIHSFLLTMAACLNRHSELCHNQLPSNFKTLPFGIVDFCFVLVIPTHKDDWLSPLKTALEESMKPLINSWNLSSESVKVFNEQFAKDAGLITP